MDFLPPKFISDHWGYGSIAANEDGTLFASVNEDHHCVHIYSLVDSIADPVVVRSLGTYGSSREQLHNPGSACFVRRGGVETLLICDRGNNRVVEVTASGKFLRIIAGKEGISPYGIAYCGKSDIIAVSLWNAHSVVLLQYESGAMKPEVIIGSNAGVADGQLYCPMGVSFTADGDCVLVADFSNDRVSKFSAGSGAFVEHVATGILGPCDVQQCGDGSIVLAQDMLSGDVVCVGVDGSSLEELVIPTDGAFPSACALSYSPSVNSIFVRDCFGTVHLFRDAWVRSPRAAWLHATCME